MSFTIESETQNRIPFHDLQVIRENKTFTTSFYCKFPFIGVQTHFDSFLPSTYNFGTVYTLAYRYFQVCSGWTEVTH